MAKFVVIVSMLVHLGIICSSETPDIIRGERDKFSKDYYRGENITCSDGYCTCPENSNTFIYDSNKSPPGKCVKDQNINSEDLSGGRFLAEGNKCLGVSKNGEIKNLTCNKTDASVLWLWISEGYMLNLRTLKCLELKETKLILQQCRKWNTTQQWTTTGRKDKNNFAVQNVQVRTYTKNWLHDENSNLYYTGSETSLTTYSKKGCYRFSDGRFMHLVDRKSGCGTSCNLDLTIHAPIMFNNEDNTGCVLDEMSEYSIDGQKWTAIIKSNLEGISVNNKSREEITLKIKNKSALREKLPGCLLKLRIRCQSTFIERHCILLKIEGRTKKDSTVTDKTGPQPRTSSHEQSTTSSTAPTSPTVSPITTNSTSPILFVVPVVVLLCLLLVAVGIILFYRRRKRSRIKEDSHLYEESNPSGNVRTRNSAQPSELQESPHHDYQYAGGNIYSQATYADPNSTISTQPNPRGNQEFSYDYATREVTPMIPLILAGENILDDGTSGSPSQQPAKVLGPNANGGVDREVRKGTLNDRPVYHTLENEGDNAGTEVDSKGQEGTLNDKPIYHTLENEGDNVGSGVDSKGQEGTLNDKPIYHTLENEGDNAGTGKDREEHKGTLNDKPIYHTLENNDAT